MFMCTCACSAEDCAFERHRAGDVDVRLVDLLGGEAERPEGVELRIVEVGVGQDLLQQRLAHRPLVEDEADQAIDSPRAKGSSKGEKGKKGKSPEGRMCVSCYFTT